MSSILIKRAKVLFGDKFLIKDILISNSILKKIENNINDYADKVIDAENLLLLPGLIDIHVHLRQPGYEYKETIQTGSLAASKGGYTTICAMPNTNPAMDSLEKVLKFQKNAKLDSKINVLTYSSITKERKTNSPLVDFEKLAKHVFAFSNDGNGIQSRELMKQAMMQAKKVNKAIVAHCEDDELVNGGCIHECEFAKKNNLKAICSASEYEQVRRDIELAKETGCQYHVCHVSTKEAVEFVREAKKEKNKISCETTPHHLLLNDTNLKNDGCYKMNPPIRSKQDQNELINGIKDGTIEIIATDHAPHSHEEKSKGLKDSMFGIVGIEFAFSLLYTNLVKTGIISIKKLIDLMSNNPNHIFNMNQLYLEVGCKPNFILVDENLKQQIDSKEFLSKGKSTPFDKQWCYGWPVLNICNGKIAYEKLRDKNESSN